MRKSNLIEQLDQAIDRILANPNARLSGFDFRGRGVGRARCAATQPATQKIQSATGKKFAKEKSYGDCLEPVTTVDVIASPRLAFQDVDKAIEFYKRAFGATETFRFNVGGKAQHAEIKIGASLINLAGEWPEGGRLSAETLGQSPIEMRVRADDVDSFAAISGSLGTLQPILKT